MCKVRSSKSKECILTSALLRVPVVANSIAVLSVDHAKAIAARVLNLPDCSGGTER